MLQLYAPSPGRAESGSVKSTTIAPAHPLADGRTSAAPLVQALRGDRPGRTPVWFMRQAGRSLPEYREVRQGVGMLESCLRPELASEITLQPVRRHGVDAAVFFSDIVVPLKLAGVGVDIKAGVGPVMDQPYRTADDVARLVSSTLDDAALDPIREAVALTVAELGVDAAPRLRRGTLHARRVPRGGQAVARPPRRTHPDARRPRHVGRARDLDRGPHRGLPPGAGRGGASAVQLFDSWAGSLSLADYTSRVAPSSTRALAYVADAGVPAIHFGTGTGHLLPAMRDVLVSAGITDHAVGIDYRTPLDEAAALLPGVPLQGNIDPALLAAPWEVLEAHVRDVVARGLAAPGHVVNLGHGVPPETDPTVLTRVVELVHSL